MPYEHKFDSLCFGLVFFAFAVVACRRGTFCNCGHFLLDKEQRKKNKQTKKSNLAKERITFQKQKSFKTISALWSSPLLRALETTAILFADSDKLALAHVTPVISELWSCRCDEGTPKSAFLKEHPEFARWDGWDAIDEHWWDDMSSDAEGRVCRARKELTELAKRESGVVAVVSHSTFLSGLLGMSFANGEQRWMSLEEFQSSAGSIK